MDETVLQIPGAPMWLNALLTVVGMLVAYFGVPWLRNGAAASKANATKLTAETGLTLMQQRKLLVERIKEFTLGTAAAIAEKRFPALARRIIMGEFKDDTGAKVKAELLSWGAELRNTTKAYFLDEGIDLVEHIGDEYLDMLIERAANAVSPFPGKETAVELLKNNVSNMLVSHGVDWMKRYYAGQVSDQELMLAANIKVLARPVLEQAGS